MKCFDSSDSGKTHSEMIKMVPRVSIKEKAQIWMWFRFTVSWYFTCLLFISLYNIAIWDVKLPTPGKKELPERIMGNLNGSLLLSLAENCALLLQYCIHENNDYKNRDLECHSNVNDKIENHNHNEYP